MRKVRLFFLLLLLFLFLVPCNIYAKDYSIKSADFTVQINSDGSADITEVRNYSFDGSYTWADEWIPLGSKCKSGEGEACVDYKIVNFTLSEGRTLYEEDITATAGNYFTTVS